jgi:uncharacterized protein (DUF433 family)
MITLAAFGIDDAARLTGLSVRQLKSWDRSEFFQPEFAAKDRHLPHSRVYSFRDVVRLRTLGLLRVTYRVPMNELWNVQRWLDQHSEVPWADQQFYVAGRHVFFDDPSTGERMAGNPVGQFAMAFEMKNVAADMEKKAELLRQRQPDQFGRIERLRSVQNNAPVIAGTRISIDAIRRYARAGYDTDAILREYPQLTQADVDAALRHEDDLRQRKSAS